MSETLQEMEDYDNLKTKVGNIYDSWVIYSWTEYCNILIDFRAQAVGKGDLDNGESVAHMKISCIMPELRKQHASF